MAELIGGSGYGEVQSTPPTNPSIGDTWLNTNSLTRYIYLNGEWKELSIDSTPDSINSLRNELRRNFGELFFDRSMDKLGYSDGWFDIFQNTSLVDSHQNIGSYDGDVGIGSSADYGKITSTTKTLGFVPSEVVLSYNGSITRFDPIVDNSTSVTYDSNCAGEQPVSDVTLEITGIENTNDVTLQTSKSFTDGSSTTLDISGTNNPDTGEVSISPASFAPQFTLNLSTEVGNNNYNPIPPVKLANDRYLVTDRDYNNSLIDSSGTVYDSQEVYLDNELFYVDVDYNTNSIIYNANGTVHIVDVDLGSDTLSKYSDSTIARYSSSGVSVWGNNYTYIAADRSDDYQHSVVKADTGGSSQHYQLSQADTEPTDVDIRGDTNEIVVNDNRVTGTMYIFDWNLNEQKTFNAVNVNNRRNTYMGTNGEYIYANRGDALVRIEVSTGNRTEVSYSLNAGQRMSYYENNGSGRFYASGGNNIVVIEEATFSEIAAQTLQPFSVSTHGYGPAVAIINGSNYPTLTDGDYYLAEYSYDKSPEDVTLEVNNNQVYSNTGALTNTVQTQFPIDNGTHTFDVSMTNNAAVNISANATERSTTKNPEIKFSSNAGSDTVSETGIINSGNTVDLSSSVDTSVLEGEVTIDVNLDTVSDGPKNELKLKYEHDGLRESGNFSFILKDGNGNQFGPVEKDKIVQLQSFDSQEIQTKIWLNELFGSVELEDYAVYFN